MTRAQELATKYRTLLNRNGINTPLRLAHFFAQAKVEADLKPKQENLNYSVEGLLTKFGRHRISEADARRFGRTATRRANQQAIANLIYGGEWGRKNLGNTQQNDGFVFRGAGIFQITGRANFEKLSKDTGIDFVNNPSLLLDEANSMIAAIWFWNERKLSSYADKDDAISISKIINLGNAKSKATPNHLKERIEAVNYYKTIFK